jgi:hypothetical protein
MNMAIGNFSMPQNQIQRINFVTISNERSGSSFFQRLLDSHSQIVARQEDLRKTTGKEAVTLMDQLFSSNPSARAFGFKIQYGHIKPEVENYLDTHNIKIIQLIRRDVLETALWHPANHKGDTKGGLGPPLILAEGGSIKADIPKVIAMMKILHSNIDYWYKKSDLHVYYEDFTGNQNVNYFYNPEVKQEVQTFLNVQDARMKVSQEVNRKPQRPDNEDCVTNWKELIEQLESDNIKRYWDEN